MQPMQDKENQTFVEPVPERSLLDQIAEEQARRNADIASRYKPVMKPAEMQRRSIDMQEIKDTVLVLNEDYGVIPGSTKPTLLFPGAQKICAAFGYVPYPEDIALIERWGKFAADGSMLEEPLFYYRVKCVLRRDGHDVGAGEGSCNSWESKYRYRSAQRVCPSCGVDAIKRSKFSEGNEEPGWYCHQKTGGCGAKFAASDPAIVDQESGQVPNRQVYDLVNTVLKMAHKRALVAAVLIATGASRWFTQDMEDIDTGDAPKGTREAQRNVAERKIAEMKNAPPPTPPPAPPVPDSLKPHYAVIERMQFKEVVAMFQMFHKALTDGYGPEQGDSLYYGALATANMKKGNDLGGKKVSELKAVVALLVAAVERTPEAPPSADHGDAQE